MGDKPNGSTILETSATFSEDRKYRYVLRRVWDPNLPKVVFVGLNPSTADEAKDDPTVRRCLGYARAWGFGSLVVVNLYARSSVDPSSLKRDSDPVGVENDRWIVAETATAALVIGAWGQAGPCKGRPETVIRLIPSLSCLRINATGEPAHPLYLPGNLSPIPYQRRPEGTSRLKTLETFSADEKTMIVGWLTGRVLHLQRIVNTQRNLFRPPVATILSHSADQFFEMLFRLLSEAFVLEVAKLTDPETSGRATNFSLPFVFARIVSPKVAQADDTRALLDEVLQFGEICSPARNKIISHADLETFFNEVPLSTFDDEELDRFLDSLRSLLDIASLDVSGSIAGDLITSTPGDEQDLIMNLKKGMVYQSVFTDANVEGKAKMLQMLRRIR